MALTDVVRGLVDTNITRMSSSFMLGEHTEYYSMVCIYNVSVIQADLLSGIVVKGQL